MEEGTWLKAFPEFMDNWVDGDFFYLGGKGALNFMGSYFVSGAC